MGGEPYEETEMKTLFLHISFGSAKALTRDGMGTRYNEVHIADSLWPAAG